jgi:hypothetical protein
VAEAFASRLALTAPIAAAGAGGASDLLEILSAPAREAPHSLAAQIRLIRDRWGDSLGDLLDDLQLVLDVLAEEDHAARLRWQAAAGPPAGTPAAIGIRAGEG